MAAERQGLASTSLLKRMASVARAEGPRGLAQRISERFRKMFGFMLAYLLVYPVDSAGPPPQAKVDMTVERVAPDDIETIQELAQAYEVPATVEGIQGWMSRADLCYIARVDGQIAGYSWFRMTGAMIDSGVRLFDIAPHEVYNHDDYISPAWRGKNIYPAMKARAAREIAAETGRKRIICCVYYYNKASLNASRKLGEYRAGWTGFIKLFGKKFPYLIRTRMVRL